MKVVISKVAVSVTGLFLLCPVSSSGTNNLQCFSQEVLSWVDCCGVRAAHGRDAGRRRRHLPSVSPRIFCHSGFETKLTLGLSPRPSPPGNASSSSTRSEGRPSTSTRNTRRWPRPKCTSTTSSLSGLLHLSLKRVQVSLFHPLLRLRTFRHDRHDLGWRVHRPLARLPGRHFSDGSGRHGQVQEPLRGVQATSSRICSASASPTTHTPSELASAFGEPSLDY